MEDFTHQNIVDCIITNDYYQADIKEKIEEDYEINEAFVHYCFYQKEYIDNHELKNFTLYVYDKNGDSDCRLTEENIYFDSNLYTHYSAKDWLDCDWMFSLDEDYYKDLDTNTQNEFKQFLSDKFNVKILDEINFYKDVVQPNRHTIFSNISGSDDPTVSLNIDFVKYLDDNYKLIFETERDEDEFASIPLLDKTHENNLEINNEIPCYLFDTELNEITDKSWFPSGLIHVCSESYNESKSLQKIGVRKYHISTFFNEVIIKELTSIKEYLNEFNNNKDFHSFVIHHINSLTADQITKITNIPVFLYGCRFPAPTAGGHKILNSKAKELFEKGLVRPEDLDIINPEYNTEQCKGYWETKLGNIKFTISHFTDWLAENEEIFTATLKSEEANINFWRWVKNNVQEKTVKDLPKLPVLIKNTSKTEKLSETIYFSDEYLESAGIESTVTRYDEKALFISDVYIQENDSIEEWKDFWNNAGVHSEIIDILIKSVIPNLASIEDENLPALLAKYQPRLAEEFEDLPTALTAIKVKAYDGNFYPIAQTIYIDCEKEEPFAYISIPNVITFPTADERSLILSIIQRANYTYITTLTEWQKLKINHYLKLQINNENKIRSIHFDFISELATLYNEDKNSFKSIEEVKEIRLLSRENSFEKASALTLGTKYKPYCDFENNGIIDLTYISNQYLTACTVPVTKFMDRVLNIHCDFEETDICDLSNREFSIYFWKEYLTKNSYNISEVKELITRGKFNNSPCIPTKDFVKKPGEIYSRVISTFVKKTEDWENKLPLLELPEIEFSTKETLFGLLSFKKSLDFTDCLYALFSIKGQERRSQVISWMIESYNESFDKKIQQYREEPKAVWYNTKHEEKQIRELYALDYNNQMLKQYFGTNPRIIDSQYFPAGDSFKEACNILSIDIIKSEDLSIDPIHAKPENKSKSFLNLCALLIAGIESYENWANPLQKLCRKNLTNESLVL